LSVTHDDEDLWLVGEDGEMAAHDTPSIKTESVATNLVLIVRVMNL
jgi:hypothetical protein